MSPAPTFSGILLQEGVDADEAVLAVSASGPQIHLMRRLLSLRGGPRGFSALFLAGAPLSPFS
jgi:hypothetical protein